jgi:VanZ family protein
MTTALLFLARVSGWSLVIAIVVLSLTPATARPNAFGLPGLLQHLAAYAAAAFFLTVGPCDRRWRLSVVAFLFVLAIAMEVGQIFVPGRTPGLLDILAGGLGAAAGSGLTRLIDGCARPSRH